MPIFEKWCYLVDCRFISPEYLDLNLLGVRYTIGRGESDR